jgi:hypothetical protein
MTITPRRVFRTARGGYAVDDAHPPRGRRRGGPLDVPPRPGCLDRSRSGGTARYSHHDLPRGSSTARGRTRRISGSGHRSVSCATPSEVASGASPPLRTGRLRPRGRQIDVDPLGPGAGRRRGAGRRENSRAHPPPGRPLGDRRPAPDDPRQRVFTAGFASSRPRSSGVPGHSRRGLDRRVSEKVSDPNGTRLRHNLNHTKQLSSKLLDTIQNDCTYKSSTIFQLAWKTRSSGSARSEAI